jgi:phosphotransferase system HPr (HPr) family protein
MPPGEATTTTQTVEGSSPITTEPSEHNRRQKTLNSSTKTNKSNGKGWKKYIRKNKPVESVKETGKAYGINNKKEAFAHTETPPVLPNALSVGQHLRAESTISNRLGLHARAATKLSLALEDLDAEIYLVKGNNMADAKSILDLLGLSCTRNTTVEILCSGKEAQKALDTALFLIENNFGEEE